MGQAMTIGTFAALTHLSVRTLRHYDRTAVLTPAHVDPNSGYRFYSPDQIKTARVVARLRELDVPLPEIRDMLTSRDPHERNDILLDHLDRMTSELHRTMAVVDALRRLVEPLPDDTLAVDVRREPETHVVSLASTVSHDDVIAWFADAASELRGAVAPAHRTGPMFGRYAHALFTGGSGTAALHVPVAPLPSQPLDSVRAERATLSACDLAVTVHTGSHECIEETYARLGQWVGNHALGLGTFVHERYLVGPDDSPDERDWRTEIGWEVLALSTSDAPRSA